MSYDQELHADEQILVGMWQSDLRKLWDDQTAKDPQATPRAIVQRIKDGQLFTLEPDECTDLSVRLRHYAPRHVIDLSWEVLVRYYRLMSVSQSAARATTDALIGPEGTK